MRVPTLIALTASLLVAGCIDTAQFVEDDLGTDSASDTCGPSSCDGQPAPPCTRWVIQGDCDCVLEPLPLLAACDDGNACTVNTRCDADGTCTGRQLDPAVDCDDGNSCTAETCDAAIGCVNAPRQGECEDGSPCTEGETCQKGQCGGWTSYVCGGCESGDNDRCESEYGDGNPCNGELYCYRGFCLLEQDSVPRCANNTFGSCIVEACDSTTGTCVAVPKPDASPCDDGVPCTVGDVCNQGSCEGATLISDTCGCTTDGACAWLDDGNLCNGALKCRDNLCTHDPQTVIKCPSSQSPCSTTECDPADGECKPVTLPGKVCDDGDPCTQEEACNEFGICLGSPVDCSSFDGPCAIGTCDLELGCVAEPISEGETCSGGDACTDGAVCQAGDCVGMGSILCDDEDACTVDTCDPAAGCVFNGPAKPNCPDQGVCAGGASVECRAGNYVCDTSKVPGFSVVELCDGLDNNCDGTVDEACVDSTGCPEGSVAVSSFGTSVGCVGAAGADLEPQAQCGSGWHRCGYDEFVDSLGEAVPPAGFWLAASVSYDATSSTYSVASSEALCVDFEGDCGGTRTVQAATHPGVYKGQLAYVREAWGCISGEVQSDCATAEVPGVFCCKDACAADAECDDDNPCTADTCVSNSCVYTPQGETCPDEGVCSDLGELLCVVDSYVCDLSAVAGYEPTESSCDGLDNDCDGLVDGEDPDLVGMPPLCGKQLGVCAGATVSGQCGPGGWEACGGEQYLANDDRYEASPEASCDGFDNDCDGLVDGAFAYQGALIGESCDGVGACGAGLVECTADGAGATCSTNPGASANQAGVEVCDGIDNDCDGEIDEGLAAPSDACLSVGVCATRPPEVSCQGAAGWVCDYTGVTGYEADEGTCDDVDNDCDGQIDEGFLWEGLAKDAPCNVDVCAGSVVVCAPGGASVVCSTELVTDNETCDGVDNDCDGQIDEDFQWQGLGIGEACSGVGACGAGTVECGSGMAICSTQPGGSAAQSSAEICDGVDNDCDGQVDEAPTYAGGLKKGASCDGVGACGAGTVECTAAGGVRCSTDPQGSASEAGLEACDGVDNDCDGSTDEGLTAADSTCLLTGVCSRTNVDASCVGGSWTCSYASVNGYQEGNELGLCDGLDNDCDGQTDEEFPQLGQACDGPDADACANGIFVCSSNKLGVECAQDTAQVESCDGVDNDCDGQTDEPGALGCSLYYFDGDGDGVGEGPGSCLCEPDTAGDVDALTTGDCDDEDGAVSPNALEVCDGKDNDCDGKTDAADAADLLIADGQPCESSLGVCAGVSKPAARCVGGGWQACESADYASAIGGPYEGAAELSCDGLDNDCDGLTDGADPDVAAGAPPCALQSGVCAGTVTPASRCGVGGWAPCSAADYLSHASTYEAGAEGTCDGLDNDCDGAVDDDFSYGTKTLGQSCDGQGTCGSGQVECAPSLTAVICSTDPGGTDDEALEEICDGVDNDCDGDTDEGMQLTDSTCKQEGVCTAGGVVATCTGGIWFCDYAGVTGYEGGTETLCDGKDGDCDGAVDEDFSMVDPTLGTVFKGDACGSGSCAGGVVVCADDQSGVECSSDGGGTGEACDGLDNDCDGETDEGQTYLEEGGAVVALGQSCDGVGACGAGIVECGQSGDVAVCSTDPDGSASQAQVELCDGIDNDCDGTVDEGFLFGGVAPGGDCDGTSACTVACSPDGSAAICTGGTGDEVCDGIDNDCDGDTDEGLTAADSTCKQAGVCNPSNVVATCLGAGGWSCDYAGVPNYKEGDEVGLCDGLDNDCDGDTDEEWPQLGQPCDGPDADSCTTGTTVCSGSGVTTQCGGDVNIPELCDGTDNDCDGDTDEPGAQDCTTFFADDDADTFGDPLDTACLCAPTASYPLNSGGDCNDTLPAVNPNGVESVPAGTCGDSLDNDCDGSTDAADPSCNCSSDCGSCGGGCCEESCTGGDCALECAGVCNCAFEGDAMADFNAECREDSTCDVNCDDVSNCKVLCRNDAVCTLKVLEDVSNAEIDCKNHSNCTLECQGDGNCTIDDCNLNASCMLICAGTGVCEFDKCQGTELDCGGGVKVCNRPCP